MQPMKFRLALLLAAIVFLLSACNYWVVEDKTVQVGSAQLQEKDAR